MTSIKKRLEKLERLQPRGLQYSSDDELDARIAELCNKPEIHDWLVDDTNNDPMRLRVIDLMTQQRVGAY
ncbi:hypothetical protein SAMN06296273_2667 [Nitrosomonas ureae]|uniref:Uncharacterized protein n=1 Tax=Nitrosomonas ureae TaxID=44577 RepID=A0A285C1M8_9PROT|nr:hypothetical protein [Nitrosomonas ureae]SNX61215.1 hypothetical protein SAMN06296273_2667 [Nitrosomonas ureae]